MKSRILLGVSMTIQKIVGGYNLSRRLQIVRRISFVMLIVGWVMWGSCVSEHPLSPQNFQIKVYASFILWLAFFHFVAILVSPIPALSLRVFEYSYYSLALIGAFMFMKDTEQARLGLVAREYVYLSNDARNKIDIESIESTCGQKNTQRDTATCALLIEAISHLDTDSLAVVRQIFDRTTSVLQFKLRPIGDQSYALTHYFVSATFDPTIRLLRDIQTYYKYRALRLQYDRQIGVHSANEESELTTIWPYLLVAATALRLTKVTAELAGMVRKD